MTVTKPFFGWMLWTVFGTNLFFLTPFNPFRSQFLYPQGPDIAWKGEANKTWAFSSHAFSLNFAMFLWLTPPQKYNKK